MTLNSSRHVIEDIEHADDPEGVLLSVFDECIKSSIRYSKSKGSDPDRVGIRINSINLDYDIEIPLTKLTANTASAIANRSWIIDNSPTEARKGPGAKSRSLLGEPFNLTVTTVDRKDLGVRVRYIRGASGTRISPSNIDPNTLIPVNNEGNSLCLFYAVELMRLYVSKSLGDYGFWKLKNDPGQQKLYVMKMLTEANIPTDLEVYDAKQ
ncbi:hypothetical protein Ddc_06581 [Ditylenchus destructor]|nr:hypothetical protein Ddc_06581 [Ditylenchus destructor]